VCFLVVIVPRLSVRLIIASRGGLVGRPDSKTASCYAPTTITR